MRLGHGSHGKISRAAGSQARGLGRGALAPVCVAIVAVVGTAEVSTLFITVRFGFFSLERHVGIYLVWAESARVL